MIRIMPDMQTGPAGYLLTWALIILGAIGLLFASGLGGAIVWLAGWAIILVLLYFLWKRLMRRLL